MTDPSSSELLRTSKSELPKSTHFDRKVFTLAAPIQLPFTNQEVEQLPKEVIQQGMCSAASDPDIFFSDAKADQEEAVSLCAICPVLEACLNYAIKNEMYGIWGGTTPEERQTLRSVPVITPEFRREAAEIRNDIEAEILTVTQIAAKYRVDERSIYRYKARLRKEAS